MRDNPKVDWFSWTEGNNEIEGGDGTVSSGYNPSDHFFAKLPQQTWIMDVEGGANIPKPLFTPRRIHYFVVALSDRVGVYM